MKTSCTRSFIGLNSAVILLKGGACVRFLKICDTMHRPRPCDHAFVEWLRSSKPSR